MATRIIPRPQTTTEAFAPEIRELLTTIDRSKRLRGERLQVESVLESIRSSPEGATPEEVQQRIIGGLQATRGQAREAARGIGGVLGRIFDPRVPRFDEITPIEQSIADVELGRAFEDPLSRRTREANLERIEASTRATDRLAGARGEKGFSATDLGLRGGVLSSAIGSVKSKVSPGRTSRKQSQFLDAFRKGVMESPSVAWETLNRTQKSQLFSA